jgi:cytochrome c oxidase subunit IV
MDLYIFIAGAVLLALLFGAVVCVSVRWVDFCEDRLPKGWAYAVALSPIVMLIVVLMISEALLGAT